MNTPKRLPRGLFALVTLVAALAAATISSAQNKKGLGPDMEIYLQIAEIPGEITVPGFEQQIAISAFSWGASAPYNPSSGGGLGVGKVQVQDLSFTKFFDSTSPEFFRRMVTGNHLPKVVLRVVRFYQGQRVPYLTLELKNVYITSFQTGQAAGIGENVVSENMSIAFNTAKLTHTGLDGTVTETTVGGSM